MKKKAETNNTWSIIKKIVVISVVFVVLVLAVGFSVLSIYINSSIKEICSNAQAEYRDTCAQSLIKLLNDTDQTFHNKNDAIWTLGRMRSQDALFALQNLYTGIIPDREPYNEMISQYEIRKALLRIDKNIDVSPKAAKTLLEKLQDCLPKSDMGSKQICDDLIKTISTYTDCAAAGFPIQETYPERCSTPDGRSFINHK